LRASERRFEILGIAFTLHGKRQKLPAQAFKAAWMMRLYFAKVEA
jgi:hypothetical protein